MSGHPDALNLKTQTREVKTQNLRLLLKLKNRRHPIHPTTYSDNISTPQSNL